MDKKESVLTVLAIILVSSIIYFFSNLAAGREILMITQNISSESECILSNGSWSEGRCNLPTSDAGNLCTDSSQCENFCEGFFGVGRCYGWTEKPSCYKPMYHGKSLGEICS